MPAPRSSPVIAFSSRAIALAISLWVSRPGIAALSTLDLNSQSIASVVAALLGPGIIPSNITYVGANVAAGTFGGGDGIIGFSTGIVLSSGNIFNIRGPNNTNGISTVNGTPGDADLTALTGVPTFDAAVLEFDFVPSSEWRNFTYVFASEEYPEYVGQFNDGFALFVNNVNVALVPGTGIPVTINNVNLLNNSAYYVNNELPGAPLDIQMDGLTTALNVTVTVNAGVINHIKIAVADAGDSALDSVVMLKANSFTAPSPTPTRTATRTPSPTPTISPTFSDSPTTTPTSSETPSFTHTMSFSHSPTATPSFTATPTFSHSPTRTHSPTLSVTPTVTLSHTPSFTATLSSTLTTSPTFSASPTVTATFTRTPIPLILHLLPPSPNPAPGDSAWLPWFISVDSDVWIDVFTVSGERVRNLEARRYRAGYSEREWDLRNDRGQKVASGTFIYRVTAQSDRNEKEHAFSKCAVLR